MYEHGWPRDTEAFTGTPFSTGCTVLAVIHICGEGRFPQGPRHAKPLQLPMFSHESFT